ncbi:MAG TPA: peptidoglycan-binding protein [Candidatus Paceibacterota bacterium]
METITMGASARNFIFTVCFLLTGFFLFSNTVIAAPYGEGSYNEGDFGEGEVVGGGTTSSGPGVYAPPSGCTSGASFSVTTGERCSYVPPATPPGIPPAQSAAPLFLADIAPGTTSEDVRTLQRYLNMHGFPIAPSGPGSLNNETMFFGPATKAAVIRFQIAKGLLPATGNVGPLTRAAIAQTAAAVPAATPSLSTPKFAVDLSLGDVSEDVRTLQRYLNANGFTIAASGPGSSGKETILFGPATKAALIKFQVAHNILPATGTLGPKTRAFIAK